MLLAAGVVAFAGSLAVERPERFGIVWPCALVAVIVAAGAVAADSTPLRRVPLVCSAVTIVLAACMFSRAEVQIPLSAGIVVAQLVAIASGVRKLP